MAQGCTPPQFHKLLNYKALSKKEAALAYAAIGARVIPLEPESNGPPRVKGWANPTWENPTDPESWWSAHPNDNIGVVTGFGFFVLDFDKKKGGCESYSKLCLLEKLPDTFTVKTRSGGFHVYLASGEVPLNGVDRLDHVSLPGVDVRSAGGYVAAPGSTVGTNGYQIVNGCEMAPAPAWLLEALQSRRGVDTDQTPLVELDTEESIDLATHWLIHEAPEAIQDSFGDHTTANIVVPKLKDFGISEHLALELLAEHWNSTKASPPWDLDDLEKKVHSGYKSAKLHAPGIAIAQLPHHEFKPLPQEITDAIERGRRIALGGSRESDATPKPPRKAIGWRDLHGDPPPLQWLWQDLIPSGHVTTLFGDGGTGKTLLAQQLATIVATGHAHSEPSCLGRRVTPGKVVALFCEDDENELWRRQQRINTALSLTMQDLDRFAAFSGYGHDNILVSFDQNIAKALPAFEGLAKTCQQVRPSLIIVDNIADTFGGDEIRRVHVNTFLKTYLGALAKEHGAAVLLLGHPSNAGLANKTGISGSTAWSNGVRSRLFLRRLGEDDPNPDPDARMLDLMKANYAPTGTWSRVRYEAGLWVETMAAETAVERFGAGTQRDVLLDVMARLIGAGENLSPNSRAGNDAIKRLMRTEEVFALRINREHLARMIDGLLAENRIEIETYSNNRHQYQRYKIVTGGSEE